MFCSSCGTKNPERFKFCSHCGARSLTSATVGEAVPIDAGFSSAELSELYNQQDDSTKTSPTSGSAWKLALLIGGLVVLMTLVLAVALVRPGSSLVTLDPFEVEQLIVDDAASGGFEIYVDCPAVMVGEPGDNWICEAGDQWGFSGPVEVTLEDKEGWVTWTYLF
jgi:hypothetical protein